MKWISRTDTTRLFIKLLEHNYSKFFTTWGIKKDGTLRETLCKLGVRKYLKGGTMRYDPIAKGLLPVCDMRLVETGDPYRLVNLKTLERFRLEGEEYIVVWGN